MPWLSLSHFVTIMIWWGNVPWHVKGEALRSYNTIICAYMSEQVCFTNYNSRPNIFFCNIHNCFKRENASSYTAIKTKHLRWVQHSEKFFISHWASFFFETRCIAQSVCIYSAGKQHYFRFCLLRKLAKILRRNSHKQYLS